MASESLPFVLHRPFPKVAFSNDNHENIESFLRRLSTSRSIDRFYQNGCPFGVVFLSDSEQRQLTEKVEKYCNCFFQTVLEPFRPRAEGLELTVHLSRLREWNERKSIHCLRVAWARNFSSEGEWTKLKMQAAPLPFQLLYKCMHIFEQTEASKRLTTKLESTTDPQLEVQKLEDIYKPIAEFLSYPPKTLNRAWNVLLQIEHTIEEAEENLLTRSPSLVKSLFTDDEFLKVQDSFLKEYHLLLQKFKKSIGDQKLKLWKTSLLTLQCLRKSKDLFSLDPLSHFQEELRKTGALATDIPLISDPLLAIDIDGLFCLLAQQNNTHCVELGNYTACTPPQQPFNLQLKVGIGCCRIDDKDPLQLSCITFPDRKLSSFVPYADTSHCWLHYRGISPSTIWKYNIAGYRILQYEQIKQISSSGPALPQRDIIKPKKKEISIEFSEAIPYEEDSSSNSSKDVLLNLLLSPLEIVVSELEKTSTFDNIEEKKQAIYKPYEQELLIEWKIDLVNQGFLLLQLLLKDWNSLSEGIQNGIQSDKKNLHEILKLVKTAASFVRWAQSNLDNPSEPHKRFLKTFETNLYTLQQTAMTNYLNTMQRGEQERHRYWHEVVETCKEALNGDKSLLDPSIVSLLQCKEKVDIEIVCRSIQSQTGKNEAEAQELIRHFLSTKLYEINSLDHPLYSLLGKCDQWFKNSGRPSLLKTWEEFRQTESGRKVSQILAHLDQPQLWESLTEEDFITLTPLLKSNCIDYLREFLTQPLPPIQDTAAWEKLLFCLKNESLTTLYLEKLATKSFFRLLDPRCIHRQQLIQSSKSFLVKLQEGILSRFSLSLLTMKSDTLSTMQRYVKAFFLADQQQALFEKMDAACLSHLQQLYEATPPDPQILVKNLSGCEYPSSLLGTAQLHAWLNSLSILPWNPAVWTLVMHLSSHGSLKPILARWRLAWFKQQLEQRIFDPSDKILFEASGLEGEKYFEHLFGAECLEAVELMNTHKHHFKLWLLRDENLENLFRRCTHQLNPSNSALAFSLRALAQLFSVETVTSNDARLLARALFKQPADLLALYQNRFSFLLSQAIRSPQEMPRAWVFDGIATLAIGCKNTQEWNVFRQPLREAFQGEWKQIPQSLKENPELKVWVDRLNTLLDKSQIDSLLKWKKRLERESFETLLPGDPDWLQTQEIQENAPIFGSQEWKNISLLPSSFKKKLLSLLNNFHLQSLTTYSLNAIAIAQHMLLSENFDTTENTRIELYRAIAQAASTLRRSDAKENFEQLDLTIKDNKAIEKGWFSRMAVPSLIQQNERSHLWSVWSKKLERLGIKKGTQKSHQALSWFLGHCEINESVQELLTVSDSSWKNLCLSAGGIEVASQKVFIPGLLFEDLFLSVVCGHSIRPFEILRLPESAPVLLRQELKNPTTFEHLAASSEPWSLDQDSFSALFLFNLLWGTEDHPSDYQLSPHPQGKDVYVLHRLSRPSLTPPSRQEPPAVDPDSKRTPFLPRDYISKFTTPSFLYCCRAAMQLPLSPALAEGILNLNPALTLETLLGGWSWYLQRLMQLYDPDILAREKMVDLDSRFGGILWNEKRLKNLLNRLTFLQAILRNTPEATLQDILSSFDPLGANHYTVFNAAPLKMYHLLKHREAHLTRTDIARIFYHASQKCGGTFSCQ